MAQVLLIVGASIFGLLGVAHLYFTFFTTNFEPHDASVKTAMEGTSPVLTKETTMWRAWVGFNASHSLGAMLLPAVYLPLTIFHFDLVQNSLWFSWLPVFVAIMFLILAKQYWFRVPLLGILISLVCFTAAAILINI